MALLWAAVTVCWILAAVVGDVGVAVPCAIGAGAATFWFSVWWWRERRRAGAGEPWR